MTDSRPREPASVQSFRAVARVGGIGHEQVGAAPPRQAVRARAFPDLDTVDVSHERTAQSRQSAMRAGHAHGIVNEMSVVQCRQMTTGGITKSGGMSEADV